MSKIAINPGLIPANDVAASLRGFVDEQGMTLDKTQQTLFDRAVDLAVEKASRYARERTIPVRDSEGFVVKDDNDEEMWETKEMVRVIIEGQDDETAYLLNVYVSHE